MSCSAMPIVSIKFTTSTTELISMQTVLTTINVRREYFFSLGVPNIS